MKRAGTSCQSYKFKSGVRVTPQLMILGNSTETNVVVQIQRRIVPIQTTRCTVITIVPIPTQVSTRHKNEFLAATPENRT